MGKDPVVVQVDGHRLRLTNLDKVLHPATGTTKADVLDLGLGDGVVEPAGDRRGVSDRGADHDGESSSGDGVGGLGGGVQLRAGQ